MFMVVIPILITPLLVIGSIKFQEYQNKKSEEKILNIAFINDSEDHLIKKLLSDQKGVKVIEDVMIDSLESYIKSDSLQGGLFIGKDFLNNINTNSSGSIKIYYKSSDLMSKSKKRMKSALENYKNDFDETYKKVDAILTPSTPSSAFKIGEKKDDPVSMYLNDIFTVPVNLAGLPGISIPAGHDAKGYPLGLQIIGKAFDEQNILNIAYAMEEKINFKNKITDWWIK